MDVLVVDHVALEFTLLHDDSGLLAAQFEWLKPKPAVRVPMGLDSWWMTPSRRMRSGLHEDP